MADAVGLFDEGRYEEARSLLAAETREDAVRLCYLARSAFETGREDEAWSAMARAVAADAAHPFVLQSRGILCLDAGRVEEALEHLGRAREASWGNVVVPAYQGLALFLAGREAEGLGLLEEALLPVPASLQSRVALHLESWLGPGTATFLPCVLEVEEEAEPALFAAINKYLVMPEDLAEWIHVGLFDRERRRELALLRRAGQLIGKGDAAGAVEHLAAAGPASDGLRLALAEAHLAAGDAQRALEGMEGVNEGDPYLQAFRAAALFRLGRAPEAAELLVAAVAVPLEDGKTVGDDFSVRYLEGLALLASGRPREARRAFERAFHMECPFVGKILLAACRGKLGAPPR